MANDKPGKPSPLDRRWSALASSFLAGSLPAFLVHAARGLRVRRESARSSSEPARERIPELVHGALRGVRLVVVANREPYAHVRRGDRIECVRPPGGLVTALDPVMRASGGTWIAHGEGAADRETADAAGRLRVPPDQKSYTLRRVWLSADEAAGHYEGFANGALWPLCHIAYTRPQFNASDWQHYKRVNEKFAEAVLEEIEDSSAIVFVQDYHFALLSRMVKQRRPDAVVCQFWHIPWPNSEAFRICPWREEVLDGLLGNDLLGFHLQYHCNNFLDTVERTIEAKVDYENFSVTRGGRHTLVRPFPISIDPDLMAQNGRTLDGANGGGPAWQALSGITLMVGVDRIDYTKGIPERLRAIDRLLERHPEHRERVVYVELGTPSRTGLSAYRVLNAEIDSLVEEINLRHGTDHWRPLLFLRGNHSPEEIASVYRAAGVCIVSSLHDGMNLVAKEFVAARTDERGALVLSSFTGAAYELTDALLINPYAIDDFAEVLHQALTMPAEEQERRMRRLRDQVLRHTVYRWAGQVLSEAARLLDARPSVAAAERVGASLRR